ncbi:EscU/YscU/HrcU family type III secretion system export apparatus switch protein [Agaribacterium haliotis]|uniref:EscU/YscU/HrcU family type III secretion system export apparatus switch protein n=1 Tax=Agaribacterium haliotis TaxID=2013869 RepID=UPI000BB56BBA|nr:EscU/YscU/HrcU family type III secretion system export apparatus switch protein [Agaribacterium haliotis]
MQFTDIDKKELNQVVALQYNGDGAPRLTAKGSAELADAILKLAIENDRPICENPALADLLSQLELGEEVPEALYNAVAHVLAFAYELVFACEDELDARQ